MSQLLSPFKPKLDKEELRMINFTAINCTYLDNMNDQC